MKRRPGLRLRLSPGYALPTSAGSSASDVMIASGFGPWRSSGAPARLTQIAVKPNALAPTTSQPFDDTKPIKVKGTITAMRWSNPHAWIHIDVKEADGKVANYAFEMGGINQLYRSGWKKEDLPIGAEVTIDGYLSRTDPHVANSQTIFLADGRKLVSPVPGPTGRKPEGR